MNIVKIRNFIIGNFGYRSKIAIIVIGILATVSFLVFTTIMARELRLQEYRETTLWSRAMTISANPNDINTPQNVQNLLSDILSNDSDISFIITGKDLSIMTYKNVDNEILVNPELLRTELEDMVNDNEPITIELLNGDQYYIFYRESTQLLLMRYLPYIQIFTLVILVTLITISYSSSKNNEQNRLWVGMAKETAHQLGTPSSSLLGWLEYLRHEQSLDQSIVDEIGKDISRLLKVVDRFSKIGSTPMLTTVNMVKLSAQTVAYFNQRKPNKVSIDLTNDPDSSIVVNANAPLMEWVMENLIKNSIDAIGAEGAIKVSLYTLENKLYIDVKDSGKGIPKSSIKKVFEPGFTSKTRGWGLGLSLCKRIVEENHNGKLLVAESEVNRGTTMRIILNY